MNNHPKYKMRLSLNVLNHLGINLYSNIPSVLSEVIANAWDADATEVRIDLHLDSSPHQITITDNGAGMSLDDINNKFLFVGYDRRKQEGDNTPGGRKPMGRKGIGKLSLFSIAGNIDVHSVQNSARESFRLNAQKIQSAIENKPSEEDPEVPVESVAFDLDFGESHGTRIVLSDLKRKMITTTLRALKKRIARRFSVSCLDDMRVFINGNPITLADRDYFPNLEYVFSYGEGGVPREKCKKLAENGWHERLASFDEKGDAAENGKYTVRGWIGMTASSSDLGSGGGGDNLNKISVLMRNKVAVEDVLESFDFRSMFTRYIIGEIQADFLDDEEDIATSSRQKIVEDSPKYRALWEFLKQELTDARDVRDKDKSKGGEKAAVDFFPKIQKWLDEMGAGTDTRKKAGVLLGKINKLNISNGNKKTMFKIGIQAFQSMRLQDKLDGLDAVSAENLEGFLAVTRELDDLEAFHYYQITKERLSVIEKFEQMKTDDDKERILQRFIFEHLWLLDPAWERADGTAYMEQAVTREFENISEELSLEQRRARVDIKYRTTAGVHVIVELKRASISVSKTDLEEQVGIYKDALEKCLRLAHPEEDHHRIEVVCVIGKLPARWDNPKVAQDESNSLKALNIRVVTYQSLIVNAKKAYRAYLVKAKEHENLVAMLADLDDESEVDE